MRRGDLVPVLMPNGPEFAITWLALCKFGAVSTLLNTEFRGPSLVHVLNLSGGETVVVDAALVPHLVDVADQLVHLRRLVVVDAAGHAGRRLPGVQVVDHAAVCAPTMHGHRLDAFDRRIRRW